MDTDRHHFVDGVCDAHTLNKLVELLDDGIDEGMAIYHVQISLPVGRVIDDVLLDVRNKDSDNTSLWGFDTDLDTPLPHGKTRFDMCLEFLVNVSQAIIFAGTRPPEVALFCQSSDRTPDLRKRVIQFTLDKGFESDFYGGVTLLKTVSEAIKGKSRVADGSPFTLNSFGVVLESLNVVLRDAGRNVVGPRSIKRFRDDHGNIAPGVNDREAIFSNMSQSNMQLHFLIHENVERLATSSILNRCILEFPPCPIGVPATVDFQPPFETISGALAKITGSDLDPLPRPSVLALRSHETHAWNDQVLLFMVVFAEVLSGGLIGLPSCGFEFIQYYSRFEAPRTHAADVVGHIAVTAMDHILMSLLDMTANANREGNPKYTDVNDLISELDVHGKLHLELAWLVLNLRGGLTRSAISSRIANVADTYFKTVQVVNSTGVTTFGHGCIHDFFRCIGIPMMQLVTKNTMCHLLFRCPLLMVPNGTSYDTTSFQFVGQMHLNTLSEGVRRAPKPKGAPPGEDKTHIKPVEFLPRDGETPATPALEFEHTVQVMTLAYPPHCLAPTRVVSIGFPIQPLDSDFTIYVPVHMINRVRLVFHKTVRLSVAPLHEDKSNVTFVVEDEYEVRFDTPYRTRITETGYPPSYSCIDLKDMLNACKAKGLSDGLDLCIPATGLVPRSVIVHNIAVASSVAWDVYSDTSKREMAKFLVYDIHPDTMNTMRMFRFQRCLLHCIARDKFPFRKRVGAPMIPDHVFLADGIGSPHGNLLGPDTWKVVTVTTNNPKTVSPIWKRVEWWSRKGIFVAVVDTTRLTGVNPLSPHQISRVLLDALEGDEPDTRRLPKCIQSKYTPLGWTKISLRKPDGSPVEPQDENDHDETVRFLDGVDVAEFDTVRAMTSAFVALSVLDGVVMTALFRSDHGIGIVDVRPTSGKQLSVHYSVGNESNKPTVIHRRTVIDCKESIMLSGTIQMAKGDRHLFPANWTHGRSVTVAIPLFMARVVPSSFLDDIDNVFLGGSKPPENKSLSASTFVAHEWAPANWFGDFGSRVMSHASFHRDTSTRSNVDADMFHSILYGGDVTHVNLYRDIADRLPPVQPSLTGVAVPVNEDGKTVSTVQRQSGDMTGGLIKMSDSIELQLRPRGMAIEVKDHLSSVMNSHLLIQMAHLTVSDHV